MYTRRAKISHDPNNTRWTSDTARFGHKILTSQGWQPGDYLGAKDASHAEFYTAANASHIRVMNREDNKGIGMDPRKIGDPKSTGLDAFQDLLGRLNGKGEDELLDEQKSREDLKRAVYSESRWGSTRFVRGGFLIGDKIQDLIDAEAVRLRELGDDSEVDPQPAVTKAKKKQRRDRLEEGRIESSAAAENAIEPKAKRKKDRKSAKSNEVPHEDGDQMSLDVDNTMRQSKTKEKAPIDTEDLDNTKSSKKRKGKRKDKSGGTESAEDKEARRSLKNPKLKRSKSDSSPDINPTNSGLVSLATPETSTSPVLSSPDSDDIQPSSTPHSLLGSRHAVRSRNIAQKRLAVLDVAALNQVCFPRAFIRCHL